MPSVRLLSLPAGHAVTGWNGMSPWVFFSAVILGAVEPLPLAVVLPSPCAISMIIEEAVSRPVVGRAPFLEAQGRVALIA